MSPAQQRRVRELFEAALDRESADAQRWLGDAAADDPAVRDEVLSLLDHHSHAGRFLEKGITDHTVQLLVAEDRLAPGTTVGSYVIVSLIGAGGMGVVYRARDSRLKRDVALKILPAVFAGDPERMARFQREAEVLASMNHPNIATMYGIEANALVMEVVEGENLRGPLPRGDALHLARQIIDALEYAHERGVIHRDLKPANVKVTPDGVAKLLDFGLAKVLEDPAAAGGLNESPILTHAAARAGVILGTAAYMAPEQALRKAADRRADIWSFGAVLYEMLTGKQAFSGESISDTLASVLKVEPDWAALPADTPTAVRMLLRRCLTKDRTQRLQAIGEARIVIDEVLGGTADSVTAPAATAGRARRLAIAGWSAAAILAAVVVAGWGTRNARSVVPRPVVRFTDAVPLAKGYGALALSRDGVQLAFVGGASRQIHVRRLDQLESRALAGTDGAMGLSFSPDGQWIGFSTPLDRRLKKIPVAGGPVQMLVDALVFSPTSVSWTMDEIFFPNHGAVMKIPAGGGNAEMIVTPSPGVGVDRPQLLPGGRQLLFNASRDSFPGGFEISVKVLNLQTGEQKTLLERAGLAQFVSTGATTGHILYYDRATASIMAVPLDLTRLEVKGLPAVVYEGIEGVGAAGLFTISDSGTLVYGAGAPLSGTSLVWVERDGTEHPAASDRRPYMDARLAPDGQRVAVTILEAGDSRDIWIRDLARGTLNRVTNEGSASFPVWTADGNRVIYQRRGARDPAVVSVPADGSGPPTVLATIGNGQIAPGSVSPDGTILIGSLSTERQQMFVLPLPAREAKPQPFLNGRFSGLEPVFSPDGAWVAYSSDESGQPEVYVTAGEGGGRFPISANRGRRPRWSRSGRELFYRSGNKMMVVDVETRPRFRAGIPKMLFEGDYGNSYDVDQDGKRFLMIKPPAVDPSTTGRIHIVLNWFEELRRRVPLD